MSIVSMHSNLLPTILNHTSSSEREGSSVGRKRYLEDLPDVQETTKRVKVAGSSLSFQTTSNGKVFTSPNITEPMINTSSASCQTSTSAYQYQYLGHSSSRYYSSSTKHSLDYPDTCINDEDWRYNLEYWINKNFPEKFQTLKNLLKLDKPGFDLLNDAILISELKEQLDNNRQGKSQMFNSKISKKMSSSYNRGSSNHSYYSRCMTSLSPKKNHKDNNGSLSEDEYQSTRSHNYYKPSSSSPVMKSSASQSTSAYYPASGTATTTATATPAAAANAAATATASTASATVITPSTSSSTNYTYSSSQLLSPPLSNPSLASSSSSALQPAVAIKTSSVTLPPLNIREYKSIKTPTSSSHPISPESLIHNQSKPMSSPYHYEYQPSTTSSYKPTTMTSTSTPSSPIEPHKEALSTSPRSASNSFIHTTPHKGPNHSYTIHHHTMNKRKCISCHSDQSPCWRPSWSLSAGQLCNSCGLRYKKTGARCINNDCGRIPAKGEWTAMKNRGKVMIHNSSKGGDYMGYKCLHCDSEVEVKSKGDPKP